MRRVVQATQDAAKEAAKKTKGVVTSAAGAATNIVSSAANTFMSLAGLVPGTKYMVVGNPGTGKSTLLNGICDTDVFEAGVSVGGGLTQCLQSKEIDGVIFYDSPGLADVQMKEQAATEIRKVLNKGGESKIFFCLTLESGRLRPADIVTMKVILEAAEEIKHFGVIINKVEEGVYDLLTGENSENLKALALMINGSLPHGQQSLNIHLIKRDPLLASTDGGKNGKMPITDELINFMITVPANKMSKNKCNEFYKDDQEYKRMWDLMDKTIAQMNEDRALREETYQAEKKTMKEAMDIANAHTSRLMEQMQEVMREREREVHAREKNSGGLGDFGKMLPMIMNAVPPLVKPLMGMFGMLPPLPLP